MRTRRGMTLVELVIAAGLLSILLVALLSLMDDFLALWERSETRRAAVEESAGVVELLAADLAGLEPGPRGDVLAEWVFFDTDGDGVNETGWPRLRLVRHATPREIALAQAARTEKVPGQGLFEILWAVLPARAQSNDPDLRAEGVLWRGERLVGDTEGVSFFDPAYISSRGYPQPGTTQDVSRGVLWLGLAFASQTSNLRDGWTLGAELTDVWPAWDGWMRERANSEAHVWNEFGAGLVRPVDRPLLPRRVRIELELERERDLKRRTRLTALVEPGDGVLVVGDVARVPREKGRHVRVDAEWMEVLSASGDRLSVR
ncbi:MAG TPA: prepilin-type N-terminal cleavage/methylation domain-containing protein, partial [Planctomycetota bacterium]|nr:prepilin-type N-terminal cleavage/methylation domain-containing protein [Planctomycetota bacterium]